MAILVTGGAGYIGSVTVDALLDAGESVVVLDDLSRGHRNVVADDAVFYEGRIGNRELVAQIIRENDVDACMHFSAFASVAESVAEPQLYFENNFVETQRLLDALVAGGVKRFVFSSSCAVYGEPQYSPIDEAHPQWPTSPYGWTKFMVERTLEAYDTAYGLKYAALRYFNAAGATARRGENHDPETHLIPLCLLAALGKRQNVSIFGDDYPTPDGTAIRDYIHVADLANAHILALRSLASERLSAAINLGNGDGYSVREVIDAVRRVTGRTIETVVTPRRSGDPSRLIANAEKARTLLGWRPKFADLDQIIASAWEHLSDAVRRS